MSLRKHEKDYLLRKDLNYKEKFAQEMQQLHFTINSSGLTENQKNRVNELVDTYQSTFFDVIAKEEIIGFIASKCQIFPIGKGEATNFSEAEG